MTETLVEGAMVNGVAKRNALRPSQLSDWRKQARGGKRLLREWDEVIFAPRIIAEPDAGPTILAEAPSGPRTVDWSSPLKEVHYLR